MSQETEILKNVPLFAGLGEEALAALAARLRRRKMPAGTPIVYKGDPAGALYLIASGRVKVHEATLSGDEVIHNLLGPGNFFGEMSLLDGQPRSADVSTLQATELLLLEGEALRQTVQEQPAVAWTLLRILSQRLRDQNDRAEMLMTRDVAGRVADQLLRTGAVPGNGPAGRQKCPAGCLPNTERHRCLDRRDARTRFARPDCLPQIRRDPLGQGEELLDHSEQSRPGKAGGDVEAKDVAARENALA